MTRVVNLRDNLYDVYIGREGNGEDGYFGNPIVVGKYCSVCQGVHKTPGSTKQCFKVLFLKRIARDEEYRDRVLGLEGQTLGCFCKPNLCHGDVYVEWLESRSSK